jgi:DNA-binding Xre family transcriptional regulator
MWLSTQQGSSVVGLAAASGVAAATISRLEHAQVEPARLSALRLCRELGVQAREPV